MAELNWGLLNMDPAAARMRGFNYAQQVQQAARQNQAYQASQRAGQAYAGGDRAGAAKILAQSGDIEGAQGIEQDQQKKAAATFAYVGKTLPYFEQVLQEHGPEAIGPAFDIIAANAKAATGATDQELAQFRQALVSNPQGYLAALKNSIPAEYKTVAPGQTLGRQQGNTFTPIYTAPDRAKAPTVHTFTEGDKTVEKQYNPDTQNWDVLSSGPRYKPVDPNNPQNARRDAQLGIQYRKEFDALPDVKQFNEIANAYDVMAGLAKRGGSAQDDIAAIFSFMKALDPTSVVREGEFATAQNAAGVPERVRNLFNNLQNGQRLSPNQRREFAGTIKSVLDSRKPRYKQLAKQYQGYVRDSGLPESYIQERIESPDLAPASGGAPAADPQTDALLKKYGVK